MKYKKLKFKDDKELGISEIIDFLLFFIIYTALLHDITNIIANYILIFALSYFSSTSLNCEKDIT